MKLLNQPLAGLNGRLEAKLIVSLKVKLPSELQAKLLLALHGAMKSFKVRPDKLKFSSEAIPLSPCKAKC